MIAISQHDERSVFGPVANSWTVFERNARNSRVKDLAQYQGPHADPQLAGVGASEWLRRSSMNRSTSPQPRGSLSGHGL